MRLIDADELIKKACHYSFEDYHELDLVNVKDIRKAPTVITAPQWISVRDRMPEKEGLYLVVIEYNTWTIDGTCYSTTEYMSDEQKKQAIKIKHRDVVAADFLKDNEEVKDGFYEFEDDDWFSIDAVYWLETPEIPQN